MTLSITKEQFSSAIDNIGTFMPDQVRVSADGTITARCSVESAMRITFELSHILNLRPGRNEEGKNTYEDLIPMTCMVGGDIMFNWKVEVRESVIESVPDTDSSRFPLVLVKALASVAAAIW